MHKDYDFAMFSFRNVKIVVLKDRDSVNMKRENFPLKNRKSMMRASIHGLTVYSIQTSMDCGGNKYFPSVNIEDLNSDGP